MAAPLGAPDSYTPSHLAERILASRAGVEGERKRVTVLFCDVAGSTELVQALGPDGAHGLFDAFFRLALEEVHRYEGTVNQFLGDGFMALFGAPIAHEDHARRAVLAALGVRDGIRGAKLDLPEGRRLELRMGVNSGEVVVGSIGNDLRMDYTAFGDTSVLAARLQAVARPDEILMSRATAQLVEGYVLAEPGGRIAIKERVVEPFRVLGVGPRRSRVDTVGGRTLSRFVGRQQEVAALRRLLGDVRAGRGGLVTIAGDPGIGKSRVLLEVRQAAAELGLAYAEGRCLSFGRSIPYLPVLDLLRQRCAIGDDDDDAAVTDKLAGALETARQDVDRALPYLIRVHGFGHAAGEIAILDPATVKARTFEILSAVLLGDGSSPSVLAVEDVHWIDRTSEELLSALSERVAARPVLLVVTTRPEYSPPWDSDAVEGSVLGSLSATESAAVVGSLLAGREAETATRAVIDRGAGNPLFLEELAGAVREHGAGAALGVPGTLQSVLAARIDRVPDEAKRALQTASVLGRRFPLAYLERLWDEPGALAEQLGVLAERDFVHGDDGDAPTLSFKHALTQEVAYNSLLISQRKAIHGRAGRALETIHADRPEQHVELLAHHFARGDDAEQAFRYLEQANAKAARVSAMEEATAYFYEALEALDRLPDSEQNRRRRLTMLLDQTGEFHFLHRHREYYELLVKHDRLARDLGDAGLLGEFYARLGHRQWTVFADMDRAIETLTRAATLCERAGRTLGAASAHATLEWCYIFTGPLHEVERQLEHARAKLSERFHPHWYMWALGAAVLAHTHAGRWSQAIATGQEAVALGDERSEDGIVSFAATWLANARLQQGDWQGAEDYAELGLSRGPTVYFQAFAQAHLAAVHCHTGRADQGVPVLDAITGLLKATEHRPAWMHIAALLAEGQLLAGDADGAATTANELAEVSTRARGLPYMAWSRRVLAEAALGRGRLAEAQRHVEESLSAARRLGAENVLARGLAVRGRLNLERGDATAARTDLQASLEIFERLGTLSFPEQVRGALAAVGA